MNFTIFEHTQAFVKAGATFMADICHDIQEQCYIGLAGGKTPLPIYELFGQERIDATRVHLFLTDERYVSQDDVHSNYYMIKTSLLNPHEKEWGSVHTFDTSLSIDDALRVYTKEVTAVPEGAFDLLVLGVGTDGHIASLFPHVEALDTHEVVAHTETDVHPIHDRLTITPAVILKAKHILILLSGEEKQTVFEELQSPTKDVHDFPAHLLQKHDNVTVFFSR